MSFLLIAVQTVISHQYTLHLDDLHAERRDPCSSIVNHTNRKPSNNPLNKSFSYEAAVTVSTLPCPKIPSISQVTGPTC
jgi:hypothetical protein